MRLIQTPKKVQFYSFFVFDSEACVYIYQVGASIYGKFQRSGDCKIAASVL